MWNFRLKILLLGHYERDQDFKIHDFIQTVRFGNNKPSLTLRVKVSGDPQEICLLFPRQE